MLRRRILQLLSLAVIAIAALATPGKAAVLVDEGSCNSGGPGSSSCSIGMAGFSCSVTCQEGYYACCNYVGSNSGCHCVGAA